jgi:hypothetical protein
MHTGDFGESEHNDGGEQLAFISHTILTNSKNKEHKSKNLAS